MRPPRVEKAPSTIPPEDRSMSESLNGKTITITTKKNMNIDELVAVVRKVYGETGCRGCTSGGNLILREEVELPLEASVNARAVIG